MHSEVKVGTWRGAIPWAVGRALQFPAPARCLMCRLPRRVPSGRFFCTCDAVGEFNSERVVRTPEHAAFADATVMGSESQRELVWNGGRHHPSDFRTAIRKVAHNARTGHFAVIDCRGRVPLNPEALAPLASHWISPWINHSSCTIRFLPRDSL